MPEGGAGEGFAGGEGQDSVGGVDKWGLERRYAADIVAERGGGLDRIAPRKMAKAAVKAAAAEGFALTAPYGPAGDQPRAIAEMEKELRGGAGELTLLGVTGSGKTYAMASLIAGLERPSMVLAHNKTLAAQLYGEFRSLFPRNAVEYFVSYYDYYQPEAYVPARDLYIDKDSCINDQIEQLRLSATKSLIERRDVVVVATVSAIFGIGDPVDYHSMILHLRRGERPGRAALVKRLVAMQYQRDKYGLPPRHLPGAGRRDRRVPGGELRAGGAGAAVRRRDRGAGAVRTR